MSKKLLYNVLTFAILFVSSIHLRAQQKDTLFGYESFLAQPRVLHNLAGAKGWNGAWFVQNANITVPGYQIIDTAKLSYPGLKIGGNYIIGGQAYLSAGRNFDVSEEGAFKGYTKVAENRRLVGKEDSTLWVSFLLKMRQDATTQVVLVAGNYLDKRRVFAGFGYFNDSSKVNNVMFWTLKVDTNFYRTSKQIVFGETVLAVMRIKFSEVDTVSLYLNPTEAQIAAGIAPTVFSARGVTGKDLGIESLLVQLGVGTKQAAFDEFRIGNTFKSVLPVADKVLPGTSATIEAGAIANDRVALKWDAAVDNDGIWGYLIYKDSVIVDTVYGDERADTLGGLVAGQTYSFGVSSIDNSGNLSADTAFTIITMPLITDVAKANFSNQILFFPNPATHLLSYRGNENLGNGKLSVIDQVGNIVLTEAINGTNDGYLNISSLSAGSYVVLVESTEGTYRQLFLKQ